MDNYFENFMEDINRSLIDSLFTDLSGNEVASETFLKEFSNKVKEIRDQKKGLIFFVGNGASATMAEHMSHDFFQNAAINTCTCSETAHITAISNDISYEDVFSFRIGRIMSDKDMLVAISSSGNSPNIVKAVNTAREKGAFIVTFSGKSGDNKLRKLGDLNYYVPIATYGMVEAAHGMVLHCCLDRFLDDYMGGRH